MTLHTFIFTLYTCLMNFVIRYVVLNLFTGKIDNDVVQLQLHLVSLFLFKP